jgi:hypothetical protein
MILTRAKLTRLYEIDERLAIFGKKRNLTL